MRTGSESQCQSRFAVKMEPLQGFHLNRICSRLAEIYGKNNSNNTRLESREYAAMLQQG